MTKSKQSALLMKEEAADRGDELGEYSDEVPDYKAESNQNRQSCAFRVHSTVSSDA